MVDSPQDAINPIFSNLTQVEEFQHFTHHEAVEWVGNNRDVVQARQRACTLYFYLSLFYLYHGCISYCLLQNSILYISMKIIIHLYLHIHVYISLFHHSTCLHFILRVDPLTQCNSQVLTILLHSIQLCLLFVYYRVYESIPQLRLQY